MKRRASTAFILAAAVLLAAPARAQTAPSRRAKSSAPAPAAVVPAPEPLPTVVVAPAPLAAAPAREEPFARSWRAALLLGPELVDEDSAMKLRADLETDLLPLSPRAVLSCVLSVSGSYRGDSATTGGIAGVPSVTVDATSIMFELVPSLRARLDVTPALSVYADAGLGGAFSTARVETKTDFAGTVTKASSSSSAGGVVLRFGLGGSFAVSERTRIGAELFGLNSHYGDTRGRSVTVLAGLTYQL